MELLKEFTNREYTLISTALKVYDKAFEDNSAALEIACLPKMHLVPKQLMCFITISKGLFVLVKLLFILLQQTVSLLLSLPSH